VGNTPIPFLFVSLQRRNRLLDAWGIDLIPLFHPLQRDESDVEVSAEVKLCDLCRERGTTFLDEARPRGAFVGFVDFVSVLGSVFQSLIAALVV
jgi:hypothetical protein